MHCRYLKSVEELLNFLKEETDERCMVYEEVSRMTDERAAEMICRIAKMKQGQEMQNIETKRAELGDKRAESRRAIHPAN